jgi:FAD-linked sulfhydryl oxidase
VDKEELGVGTWKLLHTMAAYYPDDPSALHRVQARRFFDALGLLYPCDHCAADFREDMGKTPPKVESREALSTWLCERHNEVNEKLGKKPFKCTMRALDERWLKGDSSCWHG